ncbi:LysR family transcriptional regulator [Mesobacterium sp. TK19101]|uniref:LysR family transcriptional regulator n=1 Tax=Mesobacterium hydrothermale TaxID=3111907 RepID=A0ABU6HM83_9RHOB|nr:LysR family transcriptional regulator [Mesobacterium sp. TK19101]MEC3862986.1 LysR family transcriptional regulator [Mesobacterium sp. TK19101]
MSLSRRLLPSLTALTALETLDRLGSAAAVAQEMALSPSAVSRQLQGLEAQLGAALIRRDGRGMALTPEGRAFAQTVRAALQAISDASLALRLKPQGGTINLAILPSFGMRWLVPRLPDFARRHADITVNLSTRLRPFNFASEPFDAAIHFGAPDWPGTSSLRLMPERAIPVCAPTLVPRTVAPEALLRLPLLHIQTRPNAWADWFAQHGVATGALSGPSFDQFTTIIQAARHGMGIALPPDYLVAEDLATGTLIRACDVRPVSLGAYHLVWPRDRAASPALIAFRDWLALQVEDGGGLPG